jgi:hypothetical protein
MVLTLTKRKILFHFLEQKLKEYNGVILYIR